MKSKKTQLNNKTRDKKEKTEATKIEKQLREFLLSSEGTIPIEKAIKEANERWPE